MVELSIIIPAYCEERRIGDSLDKLAQFLNTDTYFKGKSVEVIVVAADAPDRTHEIVISKRALFDKFSILKPGAHVGKGRDVQYGMKYAKGAFIVFMDADLATPLHHLKDFYEICSADADIVIGTRNLLTYRGNVWRGLFAKGGNILFQALSGIWIEDTQCGFKMFTSSAAKQCFTRQTLMGWGFDVEILAIAKANKMKVVPVRLDDWQSMPFSTYNENPLTISIRMMGEFVRVTLNRLLGKYRAT